MKLCLLLAALAVTCLAVPNKKMTDLNTVKRFLAQMEDQYKHSWTRSSSAKREEEDGTAIMGSLEAYMEANGVDQTFDTNVDKKSLKRTFKQKKSISKPHVIYFLIDDLGTNDVSWVNDEVRTPYIDELVKDGVILDQAYAQAVCSPSRGALMTGLYPFHNGMQHDVIQWTSPECTPLDLAFLPEKLKTVGYSTHMLGKWHLGFCNEACTPPHRGFDTFFGFYQGYIDHYNHLTGASGLEGYDWRDGMDARKDLDGQYAGTLLEDRAVEIIKAYDASVPMFMYFAHAGVHTPLQAPQEFHDMYANDGIDAHRVEYLALVSQVDNSIKKVVEALKENGMYDNSVIIFQSDNGGEFHAGSNAPLRGSKTSAYEAGVKTPAFVASPLITGAAHGGHAKGLFHITDWHSSILSWAGVDASGLDGVDQTELLMNGGASAREEFVVQIDSTFPQLFGLGAIRVGQYKLIEGYPGLFDGWESDGNMDMTHALDLIHGKRAVKSSKRSDYAFDWGAILPYIAQNMDAVQLFDIDNDPEERNNLASSMPDKVAELKAKIHAYRQTEREPDLDSQVANPAGEVANWGGIWSPGWC